MLGVGQGVGQGVLGFRSDLDNPEAVASCCSNRNVHLSVRSPYFDYMEGGHRMHCDSVDGEVDSLVQNRGNCDDDNLDFVAEHNNDHLGDGLRLMLGTIDEAVPVSFLDGLYHALTTRTLHGKDYVHDKGSQADVAAAAGDNKTVSNGRVLLTAAPPHSCSFSLRTCYCCSFLFLQQQQ